MNKKLIILFAARSGFWEGIEIWSQISPPSGLLAISSFLVEEYEVKIVDQRVKGWQEQLDNLLKLDPLFVGVSFMTGTQIKFIMEICNYIKSISDVKIVAGGVHPTLFPEQTIASGLFDFLILGEGEKTILELAKALEKDGKIDEIKGIVFLDKGKIVKTKERDLIDLNELKVWPYDLVDLKKYTYIDKFGLIIETSRGCPFQCTYCYNAKFNQGRWRAKSVEKVLSEVIFFSKKYEINHFHVIDDNFFVDLNRAKKLIKLISKYNQKIKLEFQGVRADSICLMDEELMELLKKNGTVRVGIETGSQKILDLTNKQITIDQYRQANLKLASYNIRSYYNFMIGFPFEDEADLKATTRFAIELMEDNPWARVEFMAIYQPYPGTVLFDQCVKDGYFKIPNNLENWSKVNWDETNLSCFRNSYLKILKKINIASAGLIIRKYSNFSSLTFLWKIMAKVYYYIVRFRMKKFYFGLFFESFVQNKFCKEIYFKKNFLVE